jgi:hypothetical protein
MSDQGERHTTQLKIAINTPAIGLNCDPSTPLLMEIFGRLDVPHPEVRAAQRRASGRGMK